MDPKLTILIPAYNAGATIERTLASLDAQIDQNFNVIVFNDGSKDATSRAIKWCAKSLTRFKYAAGEHSGVGATRERLFRLCETEYLTFLDADDVLMPHATKLMNDAINKFNEDIFVFRFYKELEEGFELFTEQRGLTWCFGKIYKRAFIVDNGISFDPGLRTGEDSYFNAVCFEFATHRVIPIPVAIWCNNPRSITRKDGEAGLFPIMVDNIKGMILALREVKKRKKISNIKFLVPNKGRIEENIGIMANKLNKAQFKELMLYYDEFIRECE